MTRRRLLPIAVVAVLGMLVFPRLLPGPSSERAATPSPTPAKATVELPPTDPGAPPHIVLNEPDTPRFYGVGLCWSFATNRFTHKAPPPLDEGSTSDRLGSQLLSAMQHRSTAPRFVRDALEPLGLTPAWFGHQIKGISPWMAMVALQGETSWNRSRSFEQRMAYQARHGSIPTRYGDQSKMEPDPDLTEQLRLAQDLLGNDEVGFRAEVFFNRTLEALASANYVTAAEEDEYRQQATEGWLELLYASDDPEFLAIAAAELTGARYDATAEDEARILEVIERVPVEVGAPLALRHLQEAWEQEDQAAIARWWDAYRPLVEHCDAEPKPDGCGCVQTFTDRHRAALHDRGWATPTTLREHVILASGRCLRETGHPPEHADIDPGSDFGRCVQEQLGDDLVLGRDVNLSYEHGG